MFIKGMLVGLAAMLLTLILYIALVGMVLSREQPGFEVGLDILSVARQPLPWLLGLSAFTAGVYLTVRSASR